MPAEWVGGDVPPHTHSCCLSPQLWPSAPPARCRPEASLLPANSSFLRPQVNLVSLGQAAGSQV